MRISDWSSDVCSSDLWLGHGPAASLLAKQLRYIDAMKILLTDEPFDANEALRIGLINEVVPHAELMARAEKMARHIVTLPPVAVRMMKEFVVRFEIGRAHV